MEPLLRIRTGPLQIDSIPVYTGLPPHGLFVGPKGFSGWDDGADLRFESAARAGAHGAFDVPGFLSERIVSVSGHALAPSPVELGHLRDLAVGHGADGEKFRLVIDHQGKTLWADARLATGTDFPDSGGISKAKFQMQFRCADPRKYGIATTFPNADHTLAQLHHVGNFPALPVFEVTGFNGSGGYTIHGPAGKQYIVTLGLFGGDTHRIDMRTGYLYLNGVLQMGAGVVSRADLWAIPKATEVAVSVVPVSGAANITMTASVTPTYI